MNMLYKTLGTCVVLACLVIAYVGWSNVAQDRDALKGRLSASIKSNKQLKQSLKDLYIDDGINEQTSVLQAYINRAKQRPGTAAVLEMLENGKFDVLKANLLIARGTKVCADIDMERVTFFYKSIAARIQREAEMLRHTENGQKHIKERGEVDYLISCANNIISQDNKITYVVNDAIDPKIGWHMFAHGVATEKQGTCVTMALAWKIIGDELGWPVQLRTVPQHCYVHWDDGKTSTNIETTARAGFVSDETYVKKGGVTHKQRKDKIWMADLTPNRMVALFLMSRANHYQELGQLTRSFEDLLLAVELDPLCLPARNLLALHWQDTVPQIGQDFVKEFKEFIGPEATKYGEALERRRARSELSRRQSNAYQRHYDQQVIHSRGKLPAPYKPTP